MIEKLDYCPTSSGVYLKNTNACMSYTDHIFLIHLLKKYRPKKIVEIGVNSGATSALILKNTDNDSKVYGIDISEEYYYDKSKKVGWEIPILCNEEEMKIYTLLLGKDCIERMDKIGGDIDFCLLDTIHLLPSELLQFFAVYPYLKKGAILCLHDISLNFYPGSDPKRESTRLAYATRLAFVAIGSRCKMLPNKDFQNIGALIIDDETRANIDNTFYALGISWYYYPKDLIPKYRKFIASHYSEFCLKIFDSAVEHQEKLALYTW